MDNQCNPPTTPPHPPPIFASLRSLACSRFNRAQHFGGLTYYVTNHHLGGQGFRGGGRVYLVDSARLEYIEVGNMNRHWVVDQKVGQNGRRKRGTKKKSSLGTRAMGEKLDGKLNRKMHKVLEKLAKKHGLSSKRRENRCMTIDTLKEEIHTTLSTTKKSFDLGELRILALRFGDIQVMVARNPGGGPHNILIWFTLEFTKTYLGEKDAKSYPIPEILHDPSLLLSPHVFLLGILFRHRVFRSPMLVSAKQLHHLNIHPGEVELLLPFRADMKDVCVFRRAVKTLTGYEISPTEPIPYGMIAAWIRRIGEILGLAYQTIPYNLRYNAANEFDQSSDISESLRNLALDHANSVPFQKHYLGCRICADPWGILRGQEPQQALIKQSCGIGHSISKRRPVDLTPEQARSVNNHPEIIRLTKRLEGIPRGLRSEKERLKRELKNTIREEWTENQAVIDIERQLRGQGFEDRPAQKRLVEALTAPDDATLEGYYRRRDNAIDAIAAYCFVHEGRTARHNTHRTTTTKPTQPSHAGEPPADSPLHVAALSVFVNSGKERPRRCFICIGIALSLEAGDHRIDELIHEFFTSGDLSKHFRRKHLLHLRDGDKIQCWVCNMHLDHKMHLQNHALRVHGTLS
ncbi:C2H2 finger domain protein [Podospora appendiculata]|uniref:C2H2 finger domain protein n=1 Tax=Podospora appendiculata TaxID=314037 RepID=A0AAE0X8F1_9PEZI|nr:C2H2 finger domain protein [Podospora appendiculata]